MQIKTCVTSCCEEAALQESLIRLLNSPDKEELNCACLLRARIWSDVGDEVFFCSLLGGNKSCYPGLNVFTGRRVSSGTNLDLAIRRIVVTKRIV